VNTTRQRTLKNRINCTGVGLHSNAAVSITLCPAPPDSGIVFQRTDLDHAAASIEARVENVVDARFSTTIGRSDDVRVGTVEHLMAALAGCRIDNALIEIDGPEVPIMDGSAAPFIFLIECAGTLAQDAPRQGIRILKDVRVDDGERSVSLCPASDFSVSFELDYDNPVIARQDYFFQLEGESFKNELSRARTFCLEHEVDYLRSLGLAQGGSLDNAIVVGDQGILNEGGLRHDDEFVRHKILDAVGDLYLAGRPIRGHFHGVCSGHDMNHRLLKALFADASAWRLTPAHNDDETPVLEAPIAATA
jgi:UDP-3-O-[3-hydroxymyristoyl] N-acetylglucosamine deacetylase